MVDYQDYHLTADSYDETRSAVGHEIWLGVIAAHFGKLNTQRVLDAGCGTGNYALALAKHVDHISAVDVNGAMLDLAIKKAEQTSSADNIDFTYANLTELPFDNNSFDVVMFNQTLHHLDPKGVKQFTQLKLALSDAARVLRPGGLILINTSSRLQMRHSFWYLELVPEARKRGVDHMVATDDLRELLLATGFGKASRTIPQDSVLQGDAFFDHRGPRDAAWRAGDSIWSLADASELSSALAAVDKMDVAGTLKEYMQNHDQGRQTYGQITFWVAQKC